ncbi:MAG: STAS-like domain-containing protein [Elusimicrobia bacterium]|nr:STAS-like domain-containing protein [Elusimicrobiota bacterium]
MRIEIKKFGELLISRPAGRDAYLTARAYILSKTKDNSIVLDFEGVKVLTPSWADEFISPLIKDYGERTTFEHTDNPSVKATLEILGF